MESGDITRALPRQVGALYQIVRAMQTSLSLAERVQTTLQTTVDTLGLKGATLRLLTPDRRQLTLVGAYGLSEVYLAKGTIEVTRSAIDRHVLQGETVVIDNAGADPRFQYPAEAAREGIRSVLALPLSFGTRVVGVLRVYAAVSHHFSSAETAFLTAVADVAGLSLEYGRMHDALLAIAAAVNSTLNLRAVLDRALEQTVNEMGYRAAVLRLYDPTSQTLPLAAAYGLSESYLTKGIVEVTRSAMDQRVLGGEVVIVEDVTGHAGFQYPDAAQQEGLASAVSLPLQAHGQAMGVMRIYTAHPHPFSSRETEFLGAVADLVGTAIENARLSETLQAHTKNLEQDLQAWYAFLS